MPLLPHKSFLETEKLEARIGYCVGRIIIRILTVQGIKTVSDKRCGQWLLLDSEGWTLGKAKVP